MVPDKPSRTSELGERNQGKSDLDFELVEKIRKGDSAAFNELVIRNQQKVYWVARRIVGSHDEADDVVQDVFVRVYEGLKKFRGDSSFSTWLYRIAINVSLSALRRKRMKDFVPYDDAVEQLDAGEEPPDGKMLQDEYQTILKKAVDRLPAKQKLAFVMRYYDEMDFEEMARILKKSVGGLKANYFHAIRKIQQYVRKEMNS